MRFSKSFIPTVREVPADATIASHILMIRSGLIRQLVAGVYSYLPLGHRALKKAEQIVREEMDKADGIELHLPVLIPTDLYERTDRVEAFGKILFKFQDQHGSSLSLGPTHEEIITSLVAENINSYKQLPITLYQFQTKFRDEERPKSGILRTREFTMKDAYSFHASEEDLDNTYKIMYKTYHEIFKRCGLPVIAVEADSGAIGGSASHEFMVLTDVGEDHVVLCDKCKYSANVEKATRKISETNLADLGTTDDPELKTVPTPQLSTITEVSEFLKCEEKQMIKTLIYTAGDETIVALVRGDHEVNEPKLTNLVGSASIELASDETIKNLTGADVGFAGPINLAQKPDKIFIDYDVLTIKDGITGANKTDHHYTGVVPGRDFEIKEEMLADLRNVIAGDPCPTCGEPLTFRRAIELGHIFKLGTKYSSPLEAKYLDANGSSQDMIMGCYGIGVNRILAAIIESSHDENGIIWPISIAPYQVHIIPLGKTPDDEMSTLADKLTADLEADGIDVLLDDRKQRPGVKFNDADLLGIPVRVTIGQKTLADGKVELKLRRDGEVKLVDAATIAETVKATVKTLQDEIDEA